MQKKSIKILPASELDMAVIQQLAKSFDLDCENIRCNQFVVAKIIQSTRDEIIGFGRLRQYSAGNTGPIACTEIATVGVIPEERKKGVGSLIMKELIQSGPAEVFVACVIPDFFGKFGFKTVKEYPIILQKKVDFCKMYGFCDEQIFVMKRIK